MRSLIVTVDVPLSVTMGSVTDGTPPVTLVMEALFGFLPSEAPLVMTPPINRSTMLPEPTEFPVHDWMRRIFRRG